MSRNFWQALRFDKEELKNGQNQKLNELEKRSIQGGRKDENNFQIVYKVNGHIKKIRNKPFHLIIPDINNQVQHYLQHSHQQTQQDSSKQGFQNEKYKSLSHFQKAVPILNINIKPFHKQNSHTNNSINKKNQSNTENNQNSQQNVILLKQQIKFFQSPNDILSFIQTQKNIALNLQQELTELLQNSLRICWELLQKQDKSSSFNFDIDPLAQITRQSPKRDLMLIKENLDKIEDSCLQTLSRVKEERRKLQLCAICLVNKSNTILIPCMHLGTCSNCSFMLINCPFCKAVIQQRKNIYQQ